MSRVTYQEYLNDLNSVLNGLILIGRWHVGTGPSFVIIIYSSILSCAMARQLQALRNDMKQNIQRPIEKVQADSKDCQIPVRKLRANVRTTEGWTSSQISFTVTVSDTLDLRLERLKEKYCSLFWSCGWTVPSPCHGRFRYR